MHITSSTLYKRYLFTNMKPFLILGIRPEKAASDNEFEAFLQHGGLSEKDVHRIEIINDDLPEINLDDYSGIIVGGGPPCVMDHDKEPNVIRFEKQLEQLFEKVYKEDFPFLGACYGICFVANLLGGVVAKYTSYSEDVEGLDIYLTDEGKKDPLTKNLEPKFRAFAGHKESCMAPPKEAVVLAKSDKCPNHMFRIKKNIYTTQFHPELDVPGMKVRIDIYKGYGYFPEEEAGALWDALKNEKIVEPMKILKGFVERYKRD